MKIRQYNGIVLSEGHMKDRLGTKQNRYILSNKGFTLVELIVVLVLLGIVLSVTVFGALGWIDWVTFNKENDTAEDIFYAAQNQITDLDSSGALERKIREKLWVSNDNKYDSEYILAQGKESIDSNMRFNGLIGSDGVEYKWKSISEEGGIWFDTNFAKEQKTILTLKANAGDYTKYISENIVEDELGEDSDDTSELSDGARLLFEMISPYIADKSVLDGAIALEFSPEAGQVFAVCYTDKIEENYGFTYDETPTGKNISIKDRTLNVREDKMIGYYGVDTLTSKLKGRSKISDGYRLEIDNSYTLDLILCADEAGIPNGADVSFTIQGASSYNEEGRETAPSFSPVMTFEFSTADIDDGVTNRWDAVERPLEVDISFPAESDGLYAGDTVKMRLPVWKDSNKNIHIILDAADVQAQSITYATALGIISDDNDEINAAKSAFSNTFSFYRFGLKNVRFIRAEAGISYGESYSTAKAGRHTNNSDDFKEYADGRNDIHGEATTFANFEIGDTAETFGIRNGRHLYNMRFETDYDALDNQNKSFILKENIDWKKDFTDRSEQYPGNYFLNSYDMVHPKDGAKYGIHLKADESVYEFSYTADDGAPGYPVDKTYYMPFPGFRMLSYGDTFTSSTSSQIEGEETEPDHYRISNIDISFAANCIYGVYGKNIKEVITPSDNTSDNHTAAHETIRNIGKTGALPLGLFAENYGSIKNIELDNISVSGVEQFVSPTNITSYIFTSKVGGFVGENLGTIERLYIDVFADTEEFTSHIRGRSDVGGIAGHQYYHAVLGNPDNGAADVNSIIKGCINNAEVTGIGYVGGIIGRIYPKAKGNFDVSYDNTNYCDTYDRFIRINSNNIAVAQIKTFAIMDCENYGDISMDPIFAENIIDNTHSLKRGFYFGGITGAALYDAYFNSINSTADGYSDNANHAVIKNCKSYTLYNKDELDDILVNNKNGDTQRRLRASFVGGIVGAARYAYLENCSTVPSRNDTDSDGGKYSFVFGDRYVGGVAGYSVQTLYVGKNDEESNYTSDELDNIISDINIKSNYKSNYNVINGTGVLGNYAVGGIAGCFGRPNGVVSNNEVRELFGAELELNYGNLGSYSVPFGCIRMNASEYTIRGLLNTAPIFGCSVDSTIDSNSNDAIGYYNYGIGGITGLLSETINDADNIQSEAIKRLYLNYAFNEDEEGEISSYFNNLINNKDNDEIIKSIQSKIQNSGFVADGVGGIIGEALPGGNLNAGEAYNSKIDALIIGRNRVGGAVGDTAAGETGGQSSLANMMPARITNTGMYVVGKDGVGGLVGVFSDAAGDGSHPGFNRGDYYDSKTITTGFNVFGESGVGGIIGIVVEDENPTEYSNKDSIRIKIERPSWATGANEVIKVRGSMYVGGITGIQEGYYGKNPNNANDTKARYSISVKCADPGDQDKMEKCPLYVYSDCFSGCLFGALFSQKSNFPLDLMIDNSSIFHRIDVNSDICAGCFMGLYAYNSNSEKTTLVNNVDNYRTKVGNGKNVNGLEEGALSGLNYNNFKINDTTYLSNKCSGNDYITFLNVIANTFKLDGSAEPRTYDFLKITNSSNNVTGPGQVGGNYLSHVFAKIYTGGLAGYVPDFNNRDSINNSIITIANYRNRANLWTKDAAQTHETGNPNETTWYSYLGAVFGKVPTGIELKNCWNTSPDTLDTSRKKHYNAVKATYKGGVAEVNEGIINGLEPSINNVSPHVAYLDTITNNSAVVGVNGTARTDGVHSGLIKDCVILTGVKGKTMAAGVAVVAGGASTIKGCTNKAEINTGSGNNLISAGILCKVLDGVPNGDNKASVTLRDNINIGSIKCDGLNSKRDRSVNSAGIVYDSRGTGIIICCRNYSYTPTYAITSSEIGKEASDILFCYDASVITRNTELYNAFGTVKGIPSTHMYANFFTGSKRTDDTPSIDPYKTNSFEAYKLYTNNYKYVDEESGDANQPIVSYKANGTKTKISDLVLDVADSTTVDAGTLYDKSDSDGAKLSYEVYSVRPDEGTLKGVYNTAFANMDKLELIWENADNSEAGMISQYLEEAQNADTEGADYQEFISSEKSFLNIAQDVYQNRKALPSGYAEQGIANYVDSERLDEYAFAIFLYMTKGKGISSTAEGVENDYINMLYADAIYVNGANTNIKYKLLIYDAYGEFISTSDITESIIGATQSSEFVLSGFANLNVGMNSNVTTGVPGGIGVDVYKSSNAFKINMINKIVVIVDDASPDDRQVGIRAFNWKSGDAENIVPMAKAGIEGDVINAFEGDTTIEETLADLVTYMVSLTGLYPEKNGNEKVDFFLNGIKTPIANIADITSNTNASDLYNAADANYLSLISSQYPGSMP